MYTTPTTPRGGSRERSSYSMNMGVDVPHNPLILYSRLKEKPWTGVGFSRLSGFQCREYLPSSLRS